MIAALSVIAAITIMLSQTASPVPVTEPESLPNSYEVQSAQLSFTDCNGNILMDGTNEYISSVQVAFGPTFPGGPSEYYIQINFTPLGQKTFKQATQKVLEQSFDECVINIVLNGELFFSPKVSEVIDSDCVIIVGSLTKESAQSFADSINSGLE